MKYCEMTADELQFEYLGNGAPYWQIRNALTDIFGDFYKTKARDS